MTEIKPIPTADVLFDGKTRMLARFTDSTGWSAFNPSITYSEQHGYLVLLRSANNYMQDHRPERRVELGHELESPDSFLDPNEWEGWGTYTSLWNGESKYRNRMFLAKLDARKLILGNMHEVDVSGAENAAPAKIPRGLEDGRIYNNGSELRVSCTAFEPDHPPYAARIANTGLNVDSLEKPYLYGFDLFPTPRKDHEPEKNWMPVDKGLIAVSDRPEWDYVYSTGHTFTIKSKEVSKVGGFELPLRGGSQLIRMDDGTYLAVMHQMISNEFMRFASITKSPLAKRRYAHRFVEFSDKGQVLRVSDAFTFLNKSIEFAAGLARYNDRLLVTFGAQDCSAHVASLSLESVLSQLRRPRLSV